MRRAARAVGGLSLVTVATAAALESLRRQRRIDARLLVLRHCVVAAGGDGAAAARALDVRSQRLSHGRALAS